MRASSDSPLRHVPEPTSPHTEDLHTIDDLVDLFAHEEHLKTLPELDTSTVRHEPKQRTKRSRKKDSSPDADALARVGGASPETPKVRPVPGAKPAPRRSARQPARSRSGRDVRRRARRHGAPRSWVRLSAIGAILLAVTAFTAPWNALRGTAQPAQTKAEGTQLTIMTGAKAVSGSLQSLNASTAKTLEKQRASKAAAAKQKRANARKLLAQRRAERQITKNASSSPQAAAPVKANRTGAVQPAPAPNKAAAAPVRVQPKPVVAAPSPEVPDAIDQCDPANETC